MKKHSLITTALLTLAIMPSAAIGQVLSASVGNVGVGIGAPNYQYSTYSGYSAPHYAGSNVYGTYPVHQRSTTYNTGPVNQTRTVTRTTTYLPTNYPTNYYRQTPASYNYYPAYSNTGYSYPANHYGNYTYSAPAYNYSVRY